MVLDDQVHPNLEVAADGQVWLVAHEQCDLEQCQPQLWRYQGEDVWDELSIPELPRAHSFWAGADGELLSPEPRVQRIDTDAQSVVIDEVDGYPYLPPAPGGAATVDATFVGRGNTLYRFDGER